MALARLFKGIYKGNGDESERSLLTDRNSNLLVSMGMPPYAELVRQGVVWSAMSTAAVAALVVRPTTTALVTLFNNEPEGGKSCVILRAFAFNLVTGAAQSFAGLWLCAHPKGFGTITNNITARGSHRADANYGGKTFFGIDDTVTNNGWFPWGEPCEAEATGVLPGGVIEAKVDGQIIVPPQCGVSSHVVAGTVNEDFTAGFTWAEVQLDI